MRIEQIIFSFFFDLVALRYDESVDVNRTFCLFQRCENEKWHEYLSSDNALLAMLGQPHWQRLPLYSHRHYIAGIYK